MQSFQCIESIPAFSNQYQTLYLYLNIWVLYRIAKIKNTGKYFVVLLFALKPFTEGRPLMSLIAFGMCLSFVLHSLICGFLNSEYSADNMWLWAYDKDAILVIEN